MTNNDGEEINFDDFMQKMLSDFARSEGHIIAEGRNDKKAALLKFLHDNLGKLQDYIRKYDIVIVEKAGTVVFFPTRLLNEDKKDELIKQCKEDLKKFGGALSDNNDKTKTNNGSDNNKFGDMFSGTFERLNFLDFWRIGKKDINVNIEAHGLGAYIGDNLLDDVTNKKQEDLSDNNTFNIICTNNHDGPLPSPLGTQHRGARQGKLINKILRSLSSEKSTNANKHVNVKLQGESYGNAMKNYLYPELYEFFKECENKKDCNGKHYITLHYIIERPYLPMETRYTLGISDMLCNLLGQKQPENVVIELKYSPKWIDLLHPTCVAKETENMLMTNFNTRDNMQEDEKIKYFCEKIPKTYDTVDPFFAQRYKYICWFANDLKEPDNNIVASLDIEKLYLALYVELDVLRYLMVKHKNSRARVFYDCIFAPTLEEFIKMCDYKGEYIADYKTDTSDQKQEFKEYIDGVDKDANSNRNLRLRLKLHALVEDKKRNTSRIPVLKKGAAILKYVIDSHRHQRGVNFLSVFRAEIIDAFYNTRLNKPARINSESLEEPQYSYANVRQTNENSDNSITSLHDSHVSFCSAGNSGI